MLARHPAHGTRPRLCCAHLATVLSGRPGHSLRGLPAPQAQAGQQAPQSMGGTTTVRQRLLSPGRVPTGRCGGPPWQPWLPRTRYFPVLREGPPAVPAPLLGERITRLSPCRCGHPCRPARWPPASPWRPCPRQGCHGSETMRLCGSLPCSPETLPHVGQAPWVGPPRKQIGRAHV